MNRTASWRILSCRFKNNTSSKVGLVLEYGLEYVF